MNTVPRTSWLEQQRFTVSQFWRQDVGKVGSFPWLMNGHLLAVSLHCFPSVWSVSLYKVFFL